jgi:hypothetical protein
MLAQRTGLLGSAYVEQDQTHLKFVLRFMRSEKVGLRKAQLTEA